MKKLLFCAALAAVLVSLSCQGEEKKLWAKSFLGKHAPEITVQKWITKEPDRKGKFVLVDFWATWCPPCRKAVEELNRFHEEFGDRLAIVGISDEPEEVVRKFTEQHIKYFSAIDTAAALKNQYQVTGIPHCVIINPAGTVVWEGFPFLENYQLTDDVVASLLKKGV
jgi:thiol-disulfide isomerase/thioredoxin